MGSARFRVYEHDKLIVGEHYRNAWDEEVPFEQEHFDVLARYVERADSPALTIGHRSIRIGHHVGLLRVGSVSLEVYPKLGRARPERAWRELLHHMLLVVTGVRLAPQDHAALKLRTGDLYDLLVGRFLQLVEGLLREGLARSYREVEENGPAFRGRLLVGRHVRANHVRQERVFVAYEVHDADNLVNRILRRALERVARTTGTIDLRHRTEAALDDFPEISTATIRDAEWATIRLDRRTERYREALDLARMILREERPELRWGDREVIALLFDMNALFEAYLEKALRGVPGLRVRSQARKRFWAPAGGGGRIAKPDLLVFEDGREAPLVVDAKWKVPDKRGAADDDLRQVFAYLHTFGGTRGVLVYPRATAEQRPDEGTYVGGALIGGTAFADLFPVGEPRLTVFRATLLAALGLGEATGRSESADVIHHSDGAA